MYKVTLLPIAKTDIKDAADWYNDRQQSLEKDLQIMCAKGSLSSNETPKLLDSDMIMFELLY
jgi:hypothetical protein